MNFLKKSILLVAIAATLAPAAFAELAGSDKYFLEEAAKSGAKGIDVSQQALVNLNTPDVRNFAQQMLTDHTRLNTEIQALAAQKGVALPSPDGKVTSKWATVRQETDDEYIAQATLDHKETIELFEKAAKSEDPDIAAFALKTLPRLREHLEAVKQLKRANSGADRHVAGLLGKRSDSEAGGALRPDSFGSGKVGA